MASGPGGKNRADPGWKYVDPAEENNTNHVMCNFCSKHMKGGITRAKEHLIGKSGNVAKCNEVPKEVKEELIRYMKQKKGKGREEVEVANAMEPGLENLGPGLPEEDAEGQSVIDSLVSKIMKLQSVRDLLETKPVDQKEVELAVKKHLISMKQTSGKEMHTSESRSLHRRKLYEKQKHHPPNLHDDVWRLENIDKDGPFHNILSQEKINTVKDFLTLLNLDPAKLYSILGIHMATKTWIITVEHARTCTLDSTRHLYFPSYSQWKIGVVTNAVGQVTGLLSECKYTPVDMLSVTEKADAQYLVFSETQGEKFSSYEDEASLMDGFSHLTNLLYSSDPPNTEASSATRLLAPQEIGGPSCTQVTNTDPMAHASDEGHLQCLDAELQSQCYVPTFDDDMQTFYTDLQSDGHIADLMCDNDSFMMSLLHPLSPWTN